MYKFHGEPNYAWTTKDWVLPYWQINKLSDQEILSFWSLPEFQNSTYQQKMSLLNEYMRGQNLTDLWFRPIAFDRNTPLGNERLRMWLSTHDPYWRGLASACEWQVRYHPSLIKGLFGRLSP